MYAQPHAIQTDLNVTPDVAKRLFTHLSRIEKGTTDILRTPFRKDEDADRVLAKWDKVFQANSSGLDPELIVLELANKDLFGPRAPSLPWSRRKDSLSAYFEPYAGTEDPQGLSPLVESRDWRPTTIPAASRLLKRNTSSGLPYLVAKGSVLQSVVDNFAKVYARHDPYVLFSRDQEKGKTRNVWGDSIARTLRQQAYFPQLLNYQRSQVWRASLRGPDAINDSITSIFARAQMTGKNLVSIDFSKYDSTVKPELVTVFERYLVRLFQSKYEIDISDMMFDIMNTGIITPDGVMSGGHANPSGNSFTLEINSVVQRSIARTLKFLDDRDMSITGDDGVYAVDDAHLHEVMAVFGKYGLVTNESKSHVSKSYVVYLQNYYSRNYHRSGVLSSIYPTYRALNRIMYQERWANFEKFGMSGDDYYAIRTISILENCKFHPLFEKLVTFVKSGFRLTFSKSGLSKYLGMADESKGVTSRVINQYSDIVTGIKSFDTVKLLRELA